MSLVLYFFLFLGALPAVPIAFLTIKYLLRKYEVPTKGNIPISIAQLIGVSVAVTLIFWALSENEAILKALRPLVFILWAAGNIAVFVRFGWLESQNISRAILATLLAVGEIFVLSILFAIIISRLL